MIDTAHACADTARQIIRPYFRTGSTAETKSDHSPVTIADRTAEQAMRNIIGQSLPNHGILGEESGAHGQQDDFLWVLDPIDGTRAFITGRPTFGTLIALFFRGVPVLGLMDQPITGERWFGMHGQTTVFSAPQRYGEVGTRRCGLLEQAELSCTSPEILTGEDRQRFKRLQDSALRTSWGGDCYAYGLLALGQIDVIAEATMKPWDWGALVPIVHGAGGCMTDWQGQPLTLDSDGTVLACGSPELLPDAIRHLSVLPAIR